MFEDRAARPPAAGELQFNHIYTINKGTYDISLMIRGSTNSSNEEQPVARSAISILSGQNYAVMRIEGVCSAVCPPELVLFRIKPLQVEELSGIAEQDNSTSMLNSAPGPAAVGNTSNATDAFLPFPTTVETQSDNDTT